MKPVIEVSHLSKKYSTGNHTPYLTLRDSIANVTSFKKLNPREFWALSDVSFSVNPGEALGIIGNNGAGKSTLLKILSQITMPTSGRAVLRGRVSSLLEVGTGFHQELTGRENIFLNGAILGMSRTEIQAKFDEIVQFSEIGKFLDTPVKHYSSGMYMRLAFSVAAHLRSQILIIDEVLAVGDAAFQKKCLAKMSSILKSDGHTILFVSHNLPMVRELCSKALLLHNGKVAKIGTPDSVIHKYLYAAGHAKVSTLISRLPADPNFKLLNIHMHQNGQPVQDIISNGADLEINISYSVLKTAVGLRVFCDLYDDRNNLVLRTFHDEALTKVPPIQPGSYFSSLIIPANFLAPRNYEIHVLATIYNQRMCIPYPGIRLSFTVERLGIVNQAYPNDPIRGLIAPLFMWKTTKTS